MIKTNLRKACTGVIILGAIVFSFAQTPVEKHGWLRTEKQHLLNENDKIVQLKGLSFYWSNPGWNGAHWYTEETVQALVNDWECTVIRLAYDPTQPGSWDSHCLPVLNEALRLGIYVVIDYHSHDAHNRANDAISFFTQRAEEYKDEPNVIFEVYNEPITHDDSENGDLGTARETWEQIKPYQTDVTEAIRNTGSQNLIIIGTPFYCQHVGVAASDQIVQSNGEPFENIAYSFHFYAASHGPNAHFGGGVEDQYLLDAVGRVPVFVSEWGTTHSNGAEGLVDGDNTEWWFENFIDKYHLSWCNWSASDFETSSAFSGGSTNPSESGQVVRRFLGGEDEFEVPGRSERRIHSETFDVPATIAASEFNTIFGDYAHSVDVAFFDWDQDDGRVDVVDNTALEVSEVDASTTDPEDYVTYEINSSSDTKYFLARYLAPEGSGTIEIYVDDQEVGELSITSTDPREWRTIDQQIDISSGSHVIKLNFQNTTGSYQIGWLELTNDVAIARNPLRRNLNAKAKLEMVKQGFSALLPQSHSYTSYSLMRANGQVLKSGKLNPSVSKLAFEDISTGMWLLKLQGAKKADLFKAFISGQ